ncbi:MAG: aminotransferase class III-fold pyridoxal phosphate-dependent enzyme [Candidatus Eremiobacteraeota bacterium]|nr:aminotransferase class III-fold pyridoxal phosphate-dependent enzyme [Candidatus Eremiobacteraeota bacterium]
MAIELDVKASDALWRPMTQYRSAKAPFFIQRAEGSTVWDSDGKPYIDAMAGLWCVNVGYGRPQLVEAAARQMERLSYASPFRPAPVTLELAEKLAQILPSNLAHTFFTNSGSEAVETALKVARQSQQQRFPGESRYKIFARYRGYHGWTLGALGATGQVERKRRFEPLVPGFVHVGPPACDDCAGGVHAHCSYDPIAEIAKRIRYEGPETIAAMIAEPIIGGGGVIEAPPDYFARLRDVCDQNGILLIADEVITGFGRTGTMFACEQWGGAAPDIITLAKGLSSGYQPIGATVVSGDVFSRFYGEAYQHREFSQLSTFGGHPVAAAVSLANIRLLESEELAARSARLGAQLKRELSALGSPAVSEVRGAGLMIGLEMARDGLRLSEERCDALVARAKADGVLIGRNSATVEGLGNVLTIAPPLSVSERELEKIVAVLRGALRDV